MSGPGPGPDSYTMPDTSQDNTTPSTPPPSDASDALVTPQTDASAPAPAPVHTEAQLAQLNVIDTAISQLKEYQAQVPAGDVPAVIREPFNHKAPRLIPPVEIELDKTRHLRLPFWALRKFEEHTGISPWDHDRVWQWPPSLDVVTVMLWVGLLSEDPDLTLEQVERLPNLEFANIHYLMWCLDECWGKNQPTTEPPTTNGSAPNAHRAPTSGRIG